MVRASIPAEEWDAFRGDGAMRGEFRVAMLLLASAAGYPAVAREWFAGLRCADPVALIKSQNTVGTDPTAWMQFKKVCDATIDQSTTRLTKELLAKWIDRIERFAF